MTRNETPIVYTSPNNLSVRVSGVHVTLKADGSASTPVNIKSNKTVPFIDVFPSGICYTTQLDSNGVLSFVKGEPKLGQPSEEGITIAASDCAWTVGSQVMVARSIGEMRRSRPVAMRVIPEVSAAASSMGSLILSAFVHVVSRGRTGEMTAEGMFGSAQVYTASVDALQASLTLAITQAMAVPRNYDAMLRIMMDNGLVPPLQTSGTFYVLPSFSNYSGGLTRLDFQLELDVTIGYGSQALATVTSEICFEKVTVVMTLAF